MLIRIVTLSATMAQLTPVITIKQDFEPDEIPEIRLQQEYDDGTKEKMKYQSSTVDPLKQTFML